MRIKTIAVLFIFSVINTAFATTWFDSKVKDPVSGKTIKVLSIGSYGSYIYNWPSKYDGVFWPMTSPNFLRFNPESGYIAFGSDFEKISDEELKKVTAFLAKNYDKSKAPATHIDKIKWADKVYTARGADAAMHIKIYCLLSYLSRKNTKEADKYRKIALEKIEKYLKIAKPSDYRAHLYIVAGFYASLLGDKKTAEKYWNSPETFNVGKSKYAKNAIEYFKKMLASIKDGTYKKPYFMSTPE